MYDRGVGVRTQPTRTVLGDLPDNGEIIHTSVPDAAVGDQGRVRQRWYPQSWGLFEEWVWSSSAWADA